MPSARRCRRLSIPALVLAAATTAAASAQGALPTTPAQEYAINAEWLSKDLKVIRNLRELLPPGCDKLSKFRIAWAPRFNDPLFAPNRGPREAGGGAVDLHTQVSGGYLTCFIDVLAVDDEIAAVRIRCQAADFLRWNQIKFRILSAWDGTAAENDRGAEWNHRNRAALERLAAVLARDLGAPAAAEVPPALLRHVSLLTSPVERFEFGATCYDGGEPPAGRVAMDALLKADRWDLVRNVLRGPHPEGRVYAAEALLNRRPDGMSLDAADLATIRAIHALPTPIEVCEGCIVLRKPASALLALPE